MLSRVAERMYWLGRYLERIENTAQLINVNTNLVLDLPPLKYIWGSLISITGYEEQYFSRFSVQDEKNVIKFLLEDPSCSILSSLRMARENARTTREIMPNEAWEKINRLYLYANRNWESAIKRDGRHKFLQEVRRHCQELTGYLSGCMSVDEAYDFMLIGTNLERADMTTRILDVACLNLLHPDQPEVREFESILWVNVLQSLSAYQMYRQHVDDRINGEDVADFLLKNDTFPRAVAHCLADTHAAFNRLPNHDEPLRSVAHTQRLVSQAEVIELLDGDGLHQLIDELQEEISLIHNQLSSTWFIPSG